MAELCSKLRKNKQVEACVKWHPVPDQTEAFLPKRSVAEFGKEHAKFPRWIEVRSGRNKMILQLKKMTRLRVKKGLRIIIRGKCYVCPKNLLEF